MHGHDTTSIIKVITATACIHGVGTGASVEVVAHTRACIKGCCTRARLKNITSPITSRENIGSCTTNQCLISLIVTDQRYIGGGLTCIKVEVTSHGLAGQTISTRRQADLQVVRPATHKSAKCGKLACSHLQLIPTELHC